MLTCASTWCLMLFALLAGTTLCPAEPTGPLAGTARDAETLQPVAEMRVGPQDTVLFYLGAWTGSDGSYVIRDIPVGTHPLQAYGWGYNSSLVQDATAVEGQTTTADFLISPADSLPLRRAMDVVDPCTDGVNYWPSSYDCGVHGSKTHYVDHSWEVYKTQCYC
jgi:hypothetical protein